MKPFDNTILLNIYRTYTKEESVAYLKSIISPLQVEIGILKSEVEELKQKNRELKLENDLALKKINY